MGSFVGQKGFGLVQGRKSRISAGEEIEGLVGKWVMLSGDQKDKTRPVRRDEISKKRSVR